MRKPQSVMQVARRGEISFAINMSEQSVVKGPRRTESGEAPG